MCGIRMLFKRCCRSVLFFIVNSIPDKSGYFLPWFFLSVALSGQAKGYKSLNAKWIVLIIILARIVMERFLKMTIFMFSKHRMNRKKCLICIFVLGSFFPVGKFWLVCPSFFFNFRIYKNILLFRFVFLKSFSSLHFHIFMKL